MRINWHLINILLLLTAAVIWPAVAYSLAMLIGWAIVYVIYYFSKANVTRMEEIAELKEALRKSDDYTKKLTQSVQNSFDQIKVLNKKVADLKDSLSALSKKSMHRPQPQSVEKKAIVPDWHQPEFAMRSPTAPKPIMPRRQATTHAPKLPNPPNSK